MKLVRPEKLNLLTHKIFNESWVQQVIAEDPYILGLGNLILKDKERIHPKAGRLDLLFISIMDWRNRQINKLQKTLVKHGVENVVSI